MHKEEDIISYFRQNFDDNSNQRIKVFLPKDIILEIVKYSYYDEYYMIRKMLNHIFNFINPNFINIKPMVEKITTLYHKFYGHNPTLFLEQNSYDTLRVNVILQTNENFIKCMRDMIFKPNDYIGYELLKNIDSEFICPHLKYLVMYKYTSIHNKDNILIILNGIISTPKEFPFVQYNHRSSNNWM